MQEVLNNIFEPSGVNHVAAFTKLFCGLLALTVIINFRDQLAYYRSQPMNIYGKPIKLLRTISIPHPNEKWFIILGLMFLISLIVVVSGLYVKLFLAIALICYFFYFNPISTLAYIQRKTNLISFVLLILLVSPNSGTQLYAPGTEWELILVKLGLAQVYISAGIQKLKGSGWKWADGKALQSSLMNNFLWSDSKSGSWLAKQNGLCAFFSAVTLLFELTFAIIIFVPWLTGIYVITALSFHAVILITMRINYLKYILPVYMVFVTDVLFWLMK